MKESSFRSPNDLPTLLMLDFPGHRSYELPVEIALFVRRQRRFVFNRVDHATEQVRVGDDLKERFRELRNVSAKVRDTPSSIAD
jgi:hypothetical protein